MAAVFDVDPEDCSAAILRLVEIGFSEASVCRHLGLQDFSEFQWRAAAIYRQEQLAEGAPLDLAIELFLLQGSLRERQLDQVFGSAEKSALLRCGILGQKENAFFARASLYPVGSELVFSDHSNHELDATVVDIDLKDRVMYVGTDSRWLARATVRKPIESMLDLCCGSGIHALLATRQAVCVTAVDINPRAVRCTSFNAKLKGSKHLEALLGDLYEPIGERQFDLITANPPFVPAPAQEVGFRDGGSNGEAVQRRIVEGIPRHLAKGGIAQIVTELGESDSDRLEQRLRTWLGNAPIDVHVARLRNHSAEAYAIGHAKGEDCGSFIESVGRWANNLKLHGYSRVVSVLLAFKWSHTSPWTRVDDARPPTREVGEEIAALFEVERFVREPDLKVQLRAKSFVRTGPLALFEARTLGAPVAPKCVARLFGLSMSVEHALDQLEIDLLTEFERSRATRDVLTLTNQANLPEETVLDSIASLLRKGFLREAS